MKFTRYNILIILLAGVLLNTACSHKRQYFPKHIEEVETGIVRFDEAIMNVQRVTAREDIEYLYDQYPEFMQIWVEDILGIPSEDTTYLCQALPDFLEDTVYGFAETNKKVKEVFYQYSDVENEINKGFSRIKYLWPDAELPEIYFMISGFNAGIYFFNLNENADDNVNVAVGTDMYLGSDWEYYNRVVYNYQKQTMRKECIAADVLSAYLFRTHPYTGKQNRLIDNMIYRGKMMYLLSQILDDEPNYEIMGYTKEQWNWCTRNERSIWNLMMDKKDLFKTETMLLTAYLNDGPFTSEISQDCPARIGTWIGWRIAESYMEHNTNVSLQELIANDDSQWILEQSYYRP